MSITYVSRLVDAGTLIPWNVFLPSRFPQSLPGSLQNWSLHPREPFTLISPWAEVSDSTQPRLAFYLPPTLAGIERALEIYFSIGKEIGSWAGCGCFVQFAAEPTERWDFDHRLSISKMRLKIDEPALTWFSFGPHMWNHSDAQAQADYWNNWVKRFSLPVEFFVSEGYLMRRIEKSESVRKLAERKGPVPGVEIVQKVSSGFACAADTPRLTKWFEAFRDILDSRCKEVRRVSIEIWHHQLPPEMTGEVAMQRLLSQAVPYISGTVWNKWTINGFITKLDGLATLQTYSGPDDQHTVDLAEVELTKGVKVRLFLLIEKAGMRLAIESKKALDAAAFDKLERDSGFRFYRTPARERPASTSYTLSKKQFLPPESIRLAEPSPSVQYGLQ